MSLSGGNQSERRAELCSSVSYRWGVQAAGVHRLAALRVHSDSCQRSKISLELSVARGQQQGVRYVLDLLSNVTSVFLGAASRITGLT